MKLFLKITGMFLQALALLTLLACSALPPRNQQPANPLKGGVLATFEVNGETFKVWVTNPTTIQQLIDLKNGDSLANIPNGVIHRGPGAGDHNAPYSWHLDPEDIELAEMTIEACDATPAYVEENLDEFINVYQRYCAWSAELVDLQDLR